MNLFRPIRLAVRRLRLCAAAPACPSCHSAQVQLRDWLHKPARWQCRACKVVWWQDRGDRKPVGYGPEEMQRDALPQWSRITRRKTIYKNICHPKPHD